MGFQPVSSAPGQGSYYLPSRLEIEAAVHDHVGRSLEHASEVVEYMRVVPCTDLRARRMVGLLSTQYHLGLAQGLRMAYNG